MLGEEKEKYSKFKYYLRQCRICDNIFKAFSQKSKRTKGRLCSDCKDKINKDRLKLIIKTKNKVKELRNELIKLDC